MHELSLAESAVDLIEQAAVRDGFARVRTVFIEIGRLSCVDPEALRFAFEQARQGSCANGAVLEIHSVEGEGECLTCGKKMMIEQAYDVCPACGAAPLKILRGLEMRVTELDVE